MFVRRCGEIWVDWPCNAINAVEVAYDGSLIVSFSDNHGRKCTVVALPVMPNRTGFDAHSAVAAWSVLAAAMRDVDV